MGQSKLEELLESIENEFASFLTEAKSQINGKKIAGKRARVHSMALRNLMKEFKAESVNYTKE